MSLTVYEGFVTLLDWIQPTTAEVDARKSHRRTIEQGLRTEFSGFNEVVVIGSHTRDTAVHLFSDVDYLAKLGSVDVTYSGHRVTSTTTLSRLKRGLEARFTTTAVEIDGPAVVVKFGQGSGAVDVVPGVWVGTTQIDGYPRFEIPDGRGGWLATSPQRHGKYIKEEDERSGWKLSKVIKLLKAWKYARSPRIPLLGFHMELLLASERICVGPKSYQNCMLDGFRLLRDRAGAALNDPLGISGRIPAVATEAQRQTLTTSSTYAADHAASAINAEVSGNLDEAYRQWGLVFNGTFPSRR